jgi:hypothetical protein
MLKGKKRDNFEFSFKSEFTLGKYNDWLISWIHTYELIKFIEKRITECEKILKKFNERVPVIIERSSTEEKLPVIDQQK